MYLVITKQNFDDIVISKHKTERTAKQKAERLNKPFDYYWIPKYRVIELTNSYKIIKLFGKEVLQPQV